jgi:adenylyltransferase/sulfurtransferase
MKHLTIDELRSWQESGVDFQLIDVREPEEHKAFNIGGELIPFAEIIRSPGRIAHDKPVVIYCKRGVRSQIIIQRLQGRLPEVDFYNLQGGVIPLFPSR